MKKQYDFSKGIKNPFLKKETPLTTNTETENDNLIENNNPND